MDDDTGAICDALGLTDCVEVGRGGFATVHAAWDAVHQRKVAIKVIDGAAATVECRMRFERERGALGRLSHHPGIATLHHSGIAPGGSPFLVMEYLGGGTLADHVKAPLTWPEAAGIVACLAGAVETAHRADICHRDIKPENVLRSDFGSWVLADFGIALTSSDPRTRTGEFIASLAHAAPEVFEGAAPASALDIYALGTTLVTMITGRDEFGPEPAESILSPIRRIATSPVASLQPCGVPAGVEALVSAATAKDPTHRPATCLALGRALNDELIRAGHPPTRMIVVDELGDEAEDDRGSPMIDLRTRGSFDTTGGPSTGKRHPRRTSRSQAGRSVLRGAANDDGTVVPEAQSAPTAVPTEQPNTSGSSAPALAPTPTPAPTPTRTLSDGGDGSPRPTGPDRRGRHPGHDLDSSSTPYDGDGRLDSR